MSQRREPTVSSVLSSKEELMDRRRRSMQQPSAPHSALASGTSEQKSSSVLVWLVLFIALFAATAVGYTFWQLQLTNVTIAQQSDRILQLEDKLTLSDDTASQSLTSLAAKIRELAAEAKTAESEIDKLWAARNKHRKTITQLDKSLKEVKQRANQTTKTVTGIESDMKGLQQSVAGIETIKGAVASLTQSTSDQDILLQSVRERMSKQAQSLQQLEVKTEDMATNAQINNAEKRIKTNEEAVQSFDAFRRTVNRDLLQLKQAK